MTNPAVDSRPLPRFSVDDRLVAVLRAPRPDACAAVVERLVESGIRCIELTLTTPDALRELPRLRERFGDSACIGMGTVTSEATARASLDAGAEFLVTPIVAPAALELSVAAGVPVLCGAFTPTEAHAAWSAGASAVKIFPSSAVRPSYLRELRGPFPDIEAMPSGGVGFDDIVPWLADGACAVSLGGSLIGNTFTHGSSDLEGRARRARDAVDEWRAAQ